MAGEVSQLEAQLWVGEGKVFVELGADQAPTLIDQINNVVPVSYTHLTLPPICSV